MSDNTELEETLEFLPKFDDKGLIPCICSCAKSGDVLMFAFMNEESLHKTIETSQAHYYSRSRKCLWHKGATSGYTQKVIEMRTDCDQDCIWIKVEINTPEGENTEQSACHTGRKTCFYRKLEFDPNLNNKQKMRFVEED